MKVIVWSTKTTPTLRADNLIWYPGSGRLSFVCDGVTYITKRPYAPWMLHDVYIDDQIFFEPWQIEKKEEKEESPC